MGDDFWSYGVQANRKCLELMARYSHEQGLAGPAGHGRGDVRARHLGRLRVWGDDHERSADLLLAQSADDHRRRESEANVHAGFPRARLLRRRAARLQSRSGGRVRADHFNGFFYELMPAFCIGTAAEGPTIGGWKAVRCGFPASSRCPASATCSRAISTWRSRTR